MWEFLFYMKQCPRFIIQLQSYREVSGVGPLLGPPVLVVRPRISQEPTPGQLRSGFVRRPTPGQPPPPTQEWPTPDLPRNAGRSPTDPGWTPDRPRKKGQSRTDPGNFSKVTSFVRQTNIRLLVRSFCPGSNIVETNNLGSALFLDAPPTGIVSHAP